MLLCVRLIDVPLCFLAWQRPLMFHAKVGDLNACASQLDHGFTISDAEFFASDWSKWIRGMLGFDSSDAPRLVLCFCSLSGW